MLNKTLVRIIFNTFLGLILVVIWLHFVNLNQILVSLSKVKIKYIYLFFSLFFLATFLRSLRLKILLSQFPIPLKNLISLNLLSQFLSFLIPIRAGEITKGIYLSQFVSGPELASLGKSMVWVFLDRFLDFWVDLVVASLLLIFIPINLPIRLVNLTLLLMIGFSLAAALIISSQSWAILLAKKFSSVLIYPKPKEQFLRFSLSIIDGFSIFKKNISQILVIVALTVGAIISEAAIWYVIFLSLGVNLTPMNTLFGSILSALTYIVPAAPGFVGSAEASGLAIFSGVLGIDPNLSSAAAVLNHLIYTLTLPIVGIFSLYFLKFNLNLVWRKLKKGD